MFGLLVGWGPAPPSPRAVGQAGGEAAAKHACARQIPAQGFSKTLINESFRKDSVILQDYAFANQKCWALILIG